MILLSTLTEVQNPSRKQDKFFFCEPVCEKKENRVDSLSSQSAPLKPSGHRQM